MVKRSERRFVFRCPERVLRRGEAAAALKQRRKRRQLRRRKKIEHLLHDRMRPVARARQIIRILQRRQQRKRLRARRVDRLVRLRPRVHLCADEQQLRAEIALFRRKQRFQRGDVRRFQRFQRHAAGFSADLVQLGARVLFPCVVQNPSRKLSDHFDHS